MARAVMIAPSRGQTGFSPRRPLADRLLLRGLELRVFAAHDAIRMTTFPNCSPLASRSNAARASSSA